MTEKGDKWHEYGTTPYEFPEMWTCEECGDFYDAEYIKDWFNRCMTDIPVVPVRTLDHKKEYWRLSDWLMRWFEQFMEDKQDA